MGWFSVYAIALGSLVMAALPRDTDPKYPGNEFPEVLPATFHQEEGLTKAPGTPRIDVPDILNYG